MVQLSVPFFHIIIACFFISGATALIYEVIWVRLLALIFGNTVYAIGVVLTAFMSGLSLGSFLLGKWADRRTNMLRIYGALELGIALSAILSPFLLDKVTSIYVSIYHTSTPLWIMSGVRYLLSIMVLLVPTTLMGGTLPVLSRHFIRSEKELESRLGALYSINTVGGVVGTFFVGFILIRYFGLSFSVHTAAALNLAIGALSLSIGNKLPGVKEAGAGPEEIAVRPPGYRYALIAFFLSGMSAMVYEVAWSRLLVAVIGSTTYAFSLILMGFLSGIALGSFIVCRISRTRKLDLLHFSAIQIAIGLICFLTIALFNLMPSLMLKGLRATEGSFNSVLFIEFSLVLLYILLPTTLFGATFPVIAGVYNSGSGHRAGNIGKIYAANTAGAILGSAAAAFFLLPGLGSTLSIKAATAANLLVGAFGLLFLRRTRLAVASFALLIVPFLPVNVSQELLNTGVAIYGSKDWSLLAENEFLLYSKEGLNATISVKAHDTGNLSLATNGKTDASLLKLDMVTQLALGYFPLLLHPEPKNVLVVGFGSGVTLRVVADFEEVERVDCVEIEPAVLEAARYFERVNKAVYRDPKVRIILDDARNHIGASKDDYDIIISEPSNPWISGVGNLFSEDFYRLARSRMKEGGIFVQWVQLYGLRSEDLMMVLKTFSSVFPDSTVWMAGGDILIIGTSGEFTFLNYQSVAEKMKMTGDGAWNLKAYLNISDPLDFFSYFITDNEGVEELSAGARTNTDNLPFLEFNAPYSLYSDTAMRNVMALQRHMNLPRVTGIESADLSSELLYRKSRNYMKINLDGAVNPLWIENAVKQNPEDADYLAEMALVYERHNKDLEKLEPLLRRALSIAPDSPAANYAAAMHLKGSDAEKAGAYFDRAVVHEVDDFDILYEAGMFNFNEGKIKEALDLFLRAERLPRPFLTDVKLLAFIEYCYRKLGDYEASLSYLLKFVEMNPYSSDIFTALADSYLRFGKPDLACTYYKAALGVSPKSRRGEITSRIRQNCPN